MAGHERRLRWYGSTLKLLQEVWGALGVKGQVGKKSVVVIKQGSKGGVKGGEAGDGSSRQE